MLNRYRRIDTIGEGAYGVVYIFFLCMKSRFKAMDCVTGEIVAMKKVKIEDSCEGIPSTSLREISVLRSLDHENVVK